MNYIIEEAVQVICEYSFLYFDADLYHQGTDRIPNYRIVINHLAYS
jgi:hypothetical protein